jgi:hypothetical protein
MLEQLKQTLMILVRKLRWGLVYRGVVLVGNSEGERREMVRSRADHEAGSGGGYD